MGEFDFVNLPRGEKRSGWLEVAPRADGSMWRLPLLTITGAKTGPTLVVLAGVHGDEYEGIEAIPVAFNQIDPADLQGTLVMVPVCNLPAYESALRSSPVDGLNLARVFPGRAEGTVTERIAHALTQQLFRHADFLLDLHSGGVAYEIPTLIGYLHDEGELGQKSRAAAEAFGAPVIWGHPLPMPAGRSLSAAIELGVPCLYTEAAGGGFARPEDVACFSQGIFNLMRHLGMLAGEIKVPATSVHLVGDGNLDVVTLAPVAGYFRASVALLDIVEQGQVLGHIFDFSGKSIATIPAAMAGVVIMLRRIHRVHAGEGLVQVTHTLEDYQSTQL
jgi:predicted deacylase